MRSKNTSISMSIKQNLPTRTSYPHWRSLDGTPISMMHPPTAHCNPNQPHHIGTGTETRVRLLGSYKITRTYKTTVTVLTPTGGTRMVMKLALDTDTASLDIIITMTIITTDQAQPDTNTTTVVPLPLSHRSRNRSSPRKTQRIWPSLLLD